MSIFMKKTGVRKVWLQILAIVLFIGVLSSSAFAENFLWSVNGENGRVFVMGSIHFAKPDMYPLNQAFYDAFGKSEYLVVEADISKVDQNEVRTMLVGKGMYPEGDSIANHISDKTKAALEKMNLDIKQLGRMKPWLLAVNLQSQKLMSMGFVPDYGMDKHFLNKAEGKKKILELEGLNKQFEILHSLSPADQDVFLHSTLVEMNNMDAMMAGFVKAWTEGDAEAFNTLFFKDYADHPEFTGIVEKVLFARNREMTEKIEEYLNKGGDYFVIVGAGHLVGPEGVISRLQEKGYEVKQM